MTNPIKENKFDIVEKLLKKTYDFRVNLVTCRAEYKIKRDKEFTVLDDLDLNSILRFVRKSVPTMNKKNLAEIISSDFSLKYDPILDYFKALQKHSGSYDYIADLAQTIKVDNQVYWSLCLKKWITGLVACILKEKNINDQTIIFSSPQGLGKTRWIGRLVPEPLKTYFYSGHIDPKNKDSHFLLTECFLIDMDEMVGLTSAKNEALKHLLTKSTLKVRRQYATYHSNFQRRATFIASTNHTKFLKDPTGSRRFLCFSPTQIDYNHTIDMDKVYAQAVHLLRTGFKYWFEPDEINANNRKYEFLTQEEQDLMDSFSPSTNHAGGVFMTTTEIAEVIYGITAIDSSLLKRLGIALRRGNFVRTKYKTKYGFFVKQK